MRLEGPFRWAGSMAFTLQGTVSSVPFTGAAVALPESFDQNCVTTPLNRYVDTGLVILGA